MAGIEGGDVSPSNIAPLDAIELANLCESALPYSKGGQFYGASDSLSFGTGLIVDRLAYPVFVPTAGAYGTRAGPALILSHECDIDPDNIRPFNSNVLVAPITKLSSYIDSVKGVYTPEETKSFLLNVAAGKTTRLCFLPRFGDEGGPLYSGGIVDLNFLASCGVSALVASEKVCSLSGFAITTIDVALQNHLLRPKAEKPPLPNL